MRLLRRARLPLALSLLTSAVAGNWTGTSASPIPKTLAAQRAWRAA
jgi:hypothetical protein